MKHRRCVNASWHLTFDILMNIVRNVINWRYVRLAISTPKINGNTNWLRKYNSSRYSMKNLENLFNLMWFFLNPGILNLIKTVRRYVSQTDLCIHIREYSSCVDKIAPVLGHLKKKKRQLFEMKLSNFCFIVYILFLRLNQANGSIPKVCRLQKVYLLV